MQHSLVVGYAGTPCFFETKNSSQVHHPYFFSLFNTPEMLLLWIWYVVVYPTRRMVHDGRRGRDLMEWNCRLPNS